MKKRSGRLNVRTKHHFLLAISTGVLLLFFYKIIPGNDPMYLWSMATGYSSIILLGFTLLIGPWNVYFKKLNPISSDLRRDVGIWCGFTGLAHVVVGIQVHMGNIWLYFFKAVDGEESLKLRHDLFGFANYTGLIAALILLVLFALSNDISLKWLSSKRWKNIQRFNYLLFLFVLLHGIMYQVIEKRLPIIVVCFMVIMLFPIIGQTVGFSNYRKLK